MTTTQARKGPVRTARKAHAALAMLAVEEYGKATAELTREIMSLPVDDTKVILARRKAILALTTVRERLGELAAAE